MHSFSRCFLISASWHDRPISIYYRALAQKLAERGHQVILLVDGQRKDVETLDGNPKVYTWPSKRPVHLADALFLSRLVRQYRPDCLIANTGSVNNMMLFGWLHRVPHRISWYRTLSQAADIEGQLPPWKMKLLRLRKRLVYRLATWVIANSRAASQDLEQTFGVDESKRKFFHNSISDPMALIEGQAIERDVNKLVCAGRIIPTKGQDILIRALPMVASQWPGVYVEFVGDGDWESECLRLAEELGVLDRCRFIGTVEHDQVFVHMASAAITVAPSRADAFGLVNVESMAVSTPVVAARVGGITEIIRDGLDGFLVSPENPEELAQRLGLLLTDADLRFEMAKNARQHFLEHFELNAALAKQIDWFEQLVKKTR